LSPLGRSAILSVMKDEMPAFVRDLRCPGCGSFLDAPRVHPSTGQLARKCPDCLEWHGGHRRQIPTPRAVRPRVDLDRYQWALSRRLGRKGSRGAVLA
jgi:hypothetical protein